MQSQRNWWDPTYRSILINISFPDGPLEIADSIQTPSDPTFTQKSQARSFHRKSQRATKKNSGRLAATQNKHVQNKSTVRQKLTEALHHALGERPNFPAEIIWLEANALKFWDGVEDLVWKTVYDDKTTRGILRTTGQIVIPGKNTLQEHLSTSKFGIHFRKTFTPDSPPLRRGESPEIEEKNTRKVIQLLPVDINDHLMPLGASPLIYRSRVVIGETFASLSPFTNENYSDSINLKLDSQIILRLQFQILQAFTTIQTLHQSGVSHGDLHFENIIWTKNDDYPARPIDFGSTIFRAESTPEEWNKSCQDDFEEFYREAGILQLNTQKRLEGQVFDESITKAGELFPPEIAHELMGLGKSFREI